MGWTVIRFWGNDIKKHTDECVKVIDEAIFDIKIGENRGRNSVEKKLYRYIGFEDFVNLLVNNKDRFVRPITWDDKYEGYLFSHMETKDDIREIVTEMYYYL